MTIKQNIEAKRAAFAAIRAHPMCGRVEDEGGKLLIIYPEGDFCVQGVRCDHSAKGMTRALDVMERHWLESYPGA